MNKTLFYVLGIGLVVVAVLVAAIGLRFEKFPASKGVVVLGTAAFAGLVGGRGALGWVEAGGGRGGHGAELAEAAKETAGEDEGGKEAEEVGPDAAEAPTETASAEGAKLFEANGCGGCHTLAAAGSTGTTGPDLDGALKGKDEGFIDESIVDPNAEGAKGYPPDVMPQTFGDSLSPDELDALVPYLIESTIGQS